MVVRRISGLADCEHDPDHEEREDLADCRLPIPSLVLPANAKILLEFISFVTGEASDKCQREKLLR
jgi:hypothetical protein